MVVVHVHVIDNVVVHGVDFAVAYSRTFSKDGPAAGQTVPHVHVHVLPRRVGDFEPNDAVYDELDKAGKAMASNLDLDAERRPRSLEEMAAEAEELRALF
mmetsp:Transcript_3278/g.13157  ORF Transcript_3278/g.13157 Transcript_3278/m.13157 type:complete len:100 (+) Transcript_3278:409-708(+)